MSRIEPRPHQVDALTDLTRAFAVHDRAQLVMACGTGKTLVGRWHAQAADAQRVLVLVPSLALVAQTLHEWRRASGWHFEALVVCSDPTTSAGREERAVTDDGDGGDVEAPVWAAARAKVTTRPTEAARFLRQHQPGRPQVVFSTYHSAPVAASAQGMTDAAFDLVVCDEAHRLAGRPREEFRTVLDARRIVARRRLFMTATPRAFDGDGGVSMDDPHLFGPVAHTVTFGEAIAAGLLADYRVLVVAGREGEHHHDGRGPTTVPGALVDAIDGHGIRRVLSFHGRVNKAHAFAQAVDGTATPGGRIVRARHISGSMPTARRVDALLWLGDRSDRHVRVVSNARCLQEGVDVPAVDAVMFADQRSSAVDIIQAVGRVLRPSPGKTHGTVIIPVTLPPDGDDDSTLATTAFAHVWDVLRGLRAHDQRLADEIDRVVREHATGRRGGWRPSMVEFHLPDGVDEPALQLRLIQEVGSMWERNYALLGQWADAHDGKLLPRSAKSMDGTISLGEWAEQQRLAHRRGMLPAERARRLEEVPGWSWDKADARWHLTLDKLRSVTAARGTVAENPLAPSAFAGEYDCDMPRRHLGVWMATQRQAYRLGALDPARAELLEELPGWSWDGGLPPEDVAMVEALRMFVEFEKHARVPDDHMEDGLRLGAWCWAVRRRRLTGRLAPALDDEIRAASPSRDLNAARFPWEHVETQWRLGYFALRQFAAREGHAHPSGRVREALPDGSVALGQWAALQRFRHRKGDLDQPHIDLLEAMPGWQWEVELRTVEQSEPVDLPPTSKHGTAGAYSNHRCRCGPCLEWRRTSDIAWLARKRQLRDPVPAARARRHLDQLEAAGAKRTTIATVSGVALGVIRKVINQTVDQIEREHQLRLLAVTAAMCEEQRKPTGSRGRSVSRANERIDPGPTWELLDDLKARGFGIHWVSRELGYAGGLQIFRDRLLSRRIADAIADLHHRAGDVRLPTMAPTAPRPSLAELLQQGAA